MRWAPLCALVACGGGDEGSLPPCVLDAGVASELGTIDTTIDSNVHLSPMARNVFVEVFLDESLAPDLLHLELYGGQGVFRGGEVRPGSYVLGGDESRYDSCGACLLLLADRDPQTLVPSAYFLAESGRLVIDTAVDRIAGRIEDAVLRHVTIDFTDPDGAGPREASLATTTASACRTRITLAAFDLPYVEPAPDAGP